jgi:hypothetical protein
VCRKTGRREGRQSRVTGTPVGSSILSGIPNFHFGIVQGFDYRHEQHVDFIALQPCEEDPTVYRRQGSNSDERVDRNVY